MEETSMKTNDRVALEQIAAVLNTWPPTQPCMLDIGDSVLEIANAALAKPESGVKAVTYKETNFVGQMSLVKFDGTKYVLKTGQMPTIRREAQTLAAFLGVTLGIETYTECHHEHKPVHPSLRRHSNWCGTCGGWFKPLSTPRVPLPGPSFNP